MNGFLVVLLIFLSSCAYLPKDVQRVGDIRAESESLPTKTNESGVYLGSNGAPPTIAQALVGGAVMGLANILPSTKKGQEFIIDGNCVYQEKDNLLSRSPCSNVFVQLRDKSKSVVAKASTDQEGNFRLSVSEHQEYYIHVKDQKGREISLNQEVKAGQTVMLRLEP